MDTSVYVSFGVCCSDSMESSENRAGFLGMLLLELAVFVLWFRLCFAALEKLNLIKPPLSSDVQSYGVVIAGRVLFVWSECAFFSVLFWEDSKKRFWCCIRAVLEWFEFGAFFFLLLLLFIILMASMCIAPIYFPETEEHSPTSIRRQMSSCHIPHPLLKGCERQKMYFVCEWVMHWKPIERM